MRRSARLAALWSAGALAGSLTLVGCGLGAGRVTPSPLPPLALPATVSALPATAAPAAAPTPACTETTGQVIQDSYPGMLVDGEVPYRIYLPACATATGERLPVLYLFHGYPFDESHWDATLGIDEMVEAWIQANQAPRFALVMPRVPEPLFTGPQSGGPGSYEAEMLQGLLPSVEAKYPVSTSSEQRAIAGISRGGVWSLEIGMRHPEVFAAVAALSPALSVNYAPPKYDPLALAGGTAPLPERFYLAAGATDWARPESEKLAEALQARGTPVELEIVPGGHDADAWIAAFPGLLTYVLDGW